MMMIFKTSFLLLGLIGSAHAADFSSCGTNDTVALQAAITANASVNLTCVASVDQVTMTGIGKKLTASAGGGLKALSGTITLLVHQCTDCGVTGLAFDGGTASTTAIHAQDNTRLIIEANRFSSFGGTATVFAVRNTSNVYRGNTISSSRIAARGLWIGNPGLSALPDTEIGPLIERNSVTNTAATGIVCMCVNAVIRDNYVADTKGAGIALSSHEWAIAKNVLVTGNVLLRNLFHGLQSDSTANSTRSADVSVIGNTMASNAYSGMYVVRAERWIIANNVSENNGTYTAGTSAGILVDIADTILIAGNTIRNDSGTQDFPIRLNSAEATNVVQIRNAIIE